MMNFSYVTVDRWKIKINISVFCKSAASKDWKGGESTGVRPRITDVREGSRFDYEQITLSSTCWNFCKMS